MEKEVAKLKLREAQSNLEQAEIILEMHENGVRELRENIEKLKANINKKDNWRDKLTKGDYVIGRGLNGLEAWYGYNRLEAEHTFKTKEQAQLLTDKMNLMQKMHAFAHVKNDGWVADWTNLNEEKFGILYSTYDGLEVDCSMGCNYFIFGIAVKSKEIAEEMLEEFGERIEAIYNKQY